MKGVVSIVLLLLSTALCAQTAQQLKERRERLLREIQLTDQALQDARSQEKQALDAVLLLEQQLQLRQEAIRHIHQERDTLNRTIQSLSTSALQSEAEAAKSLIAYRRMARYRLYHRLQGNNPLLHFLAAPHLGTAFQQAFIYDRLASRRKQVARTYRLEKERLLTVRQEKETARVQLDQLLEDENKQHSKIALERTERNNLIRQLQRNKAALEADLKTQQTERAKLENAIAESIRKAIAAEEDKTKKATPKAKSKTTSPASKELPSTPESKKLTGDFAANRGKLPWPVERAILSRPFGEQRHHELPQVRINNTGIDLITTAGSSIKAVFDGVVTGVQWVPGYAYTVILKHGNYYTVYSNMEQVAVKKGEQVKSGTKVGQAAKSENTAQSEIHFELWQGKQRLNPTAWLSPKR